MADPRHLLHVFSTFAVGGPQIRFTDIANHFGPAFRHTVIAMDGNYAAVERLQPNVPFTQRDVDNRKGELTGNLLRFRKILQTLSPDLLLTYNWGSIEWALANRWPIAPQVHLEDGFGPEEATRQLPRRVWMRRLGLGHARRIVVPSKRLYTIAKDVWRMRPDRLQYLPNGIDCSRFAPGASAGQTTPFPRLDEKMPVIGTVAALRPEKNLVRLIDAVAQLPEPAHLVIVGDGPERAALENYAAENCGNATVTFTGHVSLPEQVLWHFDIFALSSNTEQMPLGILEAMAASLPIAAVDVGDVKHMVSNANKSFVSGADAEALKSALSPLVNDRALRQRVGAENLQHVRAHFDRHVMFNAYETIFNGS